MILRTTFAFSIAVFLSIGAASAADKVRGEQRYKSVCAVCHSIDPAQRRMGPPLKGIYGRKAGSVAGFNYSAAMKAANFNWDKTSLDEFMADPRKRVPGTSMVTKLNNAQDRADINAYMETLK